MMPKASIQTFTVALLLCLSALAALAKDTDKRDLDGFHAIAVGGGIDLVIHQGSRYAVTVHAESGDTDDVETQIEHDTLIIRKTSGFFSSGVFHGFGVFRWFEHFSVDVTLPKLENVSASGGSNVGFDSNFSAEKLQLRTSGGSDLRFTGKADSLDVITSGGSDTFLDGSARQLTVRISGGSDLHARGFEVSDAELVASGGSDIDITVKEKLSARASGGSDIRYAGNPPHTDVKASGGADIRARR
ncbi:MAG: head GIN domain-containing protein [Pseudomonadota bacterium]